MAALADTRGVRSEVQAAAPPIALWRSGIRTKTDQDQDDQEQEDQDQDQDQDQDDDDGAFGGDDTD